MSRAIHTPPAAPYAVLLASWLAGTAFAARESATAWAGAHAHGFEAALLATVLFFVTMAESFGLFFLFGFLAKAAAYLFMPERAPAARATRTPPFTVLYLTAGDFDAAAVDSLLRLEAHGSRLFVLHDDGADEAARQEMADFIHTHPCRAQWEVAIWHRPERRGGKAGAVNWVLERLEPKWELLLLCDSDSIAMDGDAVAMAAGEFADPGTAVVQFRNVGIDDADDGALQRRLATAIDVFDAFARPQARWGYLPFFGHNALIRVADLRALGGLTPGFFSDDLDFSIRLTLAGRRIVYRPDIRFGERHPADWVSFRKRARKWAFGCMQVVRARLGAVLLSPHVPLAYRVGMLEFMGFYPAQALLLAGLLLGHLVVPLLLPARPMGLAFIACGWGVTLALVSPTLAWAVRHRRLREWPAFAWCCALVYGGSILSTTQGVLDGLSSRERPWIPTNLGGSRRALPHTAWGESALGAALFALPWLRGAPEASFAATYLFVSTFLFAPLTYLAYRKPPVVPAASARWRIAGAVALVACSMLIAARAGAVAEVAVKGAKLEVEGAAFQVRGIHYSPWLPGTGPDGHSPYPGVACVDSDLDAIRGLHANTILIHTAPGWVMRHAWKRGLHTLYSFNIGWNDTSRAGFERQARGILAAVDSLRGEPGLIGWVLGNEIPQWVVDTLGAREMESRLRWLAGRVRAIDSKHLLGHGNWPPTRRLDLSFLDLACFNLYPAWPYDVAVRGYGPYLREEIVPAARGRPVIITEFGINTLEAGMDRQAQVITDCWRDIADSRVAGGVVFEWSDEWWKNYDNPVAGHGYWERHFDSQDAARWDSDPEENYGIVSAERVPKPALEAVRRMWAPAPSRAWWPWPLLLGLGFVTWWAYGSRRGPSPEERGTSG